MKPPGSFDLLAILLVGAMLAAGHSLMGDPGVGWHLKTGELVLKLHAVPATDPFLLDLAGSPWISNQWLADVVFYGLTQLGGFPLLHLFTLVLAAISFVFIPRLALERRRWSPTMGVLVVTLTALQGAVQWFVRPVMFSFLCFSLLCLWVNGRSCRASSRRKALWSALLFVLWVNLHPAWILGLVFLGLTAVGQAAEARLSGASYASARQSALMLLCGAMATVVNPFGLGLHRAIAGLASDPYFMNLNQEWFSSDIHVLFFLPFFVSTVLLVLLASSGLGKAVPLSGAATVLPFFMMALLQRRYMPFFALVSAVPLMAMSEAALRLSSRSRAGLEIRAALRRIDRRQRFRTRWAISAVLATTLLVVTLVTGEVPGPGAASTQLDSGYPHALLEPLATIAKSQAEPLRLLHTPNLGGFITLSLSPLVRAWIDDRNELNRVAPYERFLQISQLREGWRDSLTELNMSALLLDASAPLAKLLRAEGEQGGTEGWVRYAHTDSAELYVRQDLMLRLKTLPAS